MKDNSPLFRLATAAFRIANRGGLPLIFLGFCVLFAAGWYAKDLKVSQDFRRLLPQDSESIQRLLDVDNAIGNQADLFVVIEGPRRTDNIAIGNQIESELREWKDEFRFVYFERDISFFETNALLFASLPELLELHDRVQHRIREEVRASMAVEAPTKAEEAETQNDDALMEHADPAAGKLPARFFETNGGELMVVVARPSFPNTDVASAMKLYDRLEKTLAVLKEKSGIREIQLSIQGSFAEQSRRQSELDASIVKGSFLAFVILFGSIGLFFRSAKVVAWILIPLVTSIAMALAVANAIYGYLNIVSAFIVAILLGIGIDFGIHLLTRYRDERRGGASASDALEVAMTHTGASTLAGALSTGASLFLLLFAEFQGLAQFGIVAGFGVLFAFVCAALLIPPLLKKLGEGKHLASGHRVSVFATPDSAASTVKWRLVLFLGVASFLVGAFAIPKVGFEYDLDKLGSIRPEKKADPGGRKSWRAALPSGATTAAMVVVTEGENETAYLHEQLSVLREQRAFDESPPVPWEAPPETVPEEEVDDEDDPFAEEEAETDPLAGIRSRAYARPEPTERVQSAFKLYGKERVDWMRNRLESVQSLPGIIPGDQKAKLQIIQEVRNAIQKKRGALKPETLEKLGEWEKYLEVDSPVTAEQLPQWVKDQFMDVAGHSDRFLVIKTLGAKADVENSIRIRDAFATLETPWGERASAASFYVLPAVVEAIHRDGPVLLALAFAVLLLTAWFLFRSAKTAFLVAGTVGTAMVWLMGFMWFMEWKIDLFNLIAIPMIIGMGQDHALHMLHRMREDGLDRLPRIIRETGGAIGLTTWTTAIGFFGVLLAPHAGLRSLAQVSLVGMVMTLLAAVFFLPAVLLFIRGRKKRAVPTN